jgi:hypothetical protein
VPWSIPLAVWTSSRSDYDSTERAVVFTVSKPQDARISMSDIEARVAQRHTYRWLNGALLDEQDSAVLLGRKCWSLAAA